MSQMEKLFIKIISATNDNNIAFAELCKVLDFFEFESRVRGSHHIYYKDGITEIINIQPGDGNKAKPYQVKQVRSLIVKYKLGEKFDV